MKAAPDLEAPGKIIERMHQALQDERLRGVADRIETDRLKNRVGDEVVYVEVPKLEEDVHDLGGLATIASHLVP